MDGADMAIYNMAISTSQQLLDTMRLECTRAQPPSPSS
eukprot:COSAG01_NODE_70856_length_257_cov_1.202532_1_plen_37_part_10